MLTYMYVHKYLIVLGDYVKRNKYNLHIYFQYNKKHKQKRNASVSAPVNINNENKWRLQQNIQVRKR